jgi:hypothetical protein
VSILGTLSDAVLARRAGSGTPAPAALTT